MPKENQLCAPFTMLPTTNKIINKIQNTKNNITNTSVRRKNLKSIKEKIKKIIKDNTIQIICLLKNQSRLLVV